MTALPDLDTLRDGLRRVADPEIGANIVDLGLVYRIEFVGTQLQIDLTMTSPACPMGDLIVDDAYAELERLLPSTTEVDIRVVWTPPWTPAMMSPACRQRLGWNEDAPPA